MNLFIATKNESKKKELERILLPLSINVLCEKDLDKPLPEVEENGTTFEENALIKARSACSQTGYVCVADDSGLCVDAIGGQPGIYSARFAGEPTDNEKNNDKLLDMLKDVPKEKRSAKFVCAVACVYPDGKEFTVRGECNGEIAFERQGSGGFGYDPLFISEKGSFGLLSPEEKDAISHRGKALKLLAEKLK